MQDSNDFNSSIFGAIKDQPIGKSGNRKGADILKVWLSALPEVAYPRLFAQKAKGFIGGIQEPERG